MHQQHADLQPLLLAVAQGAGQAAHAVCELDGDQGFRQAVTLRRVELKEHAGLDALVGLEREFQVFKHRELLKHRGLLEFAADTQLGDVGFFVAQQVDGAAKEDSAFVGPGFAGDDVHHGGFARAVGADDAAQLTGRNVQAELVDGFEAVKADADVFKVKNAAMGEIDLASGLGDAAGAGVAPARLGGRTGLGLGSHALLCAARALFKQVGGHLAPLHFLTSPTTPLGKNKVTAMKSVPKKYSQNSG